MVSSTFQESLLRKVQRYVTLKGPRKSSVSSPSSAPRGQSPIRGVCPARSLRCRKWGHRNAAQERRPCHQRWGAGGTRRGRRNLERRRETPGRFRVTVASLLHAFHNPKSISRSSAIRRVKRREESSKELPHSHRFPKTALIGDSRDATQPDPRVLSSSSWPRLSLRHR